MIVHFAPKRGAGYLRKTRRYFREDFRNNETCPYVNHFDSNDFKSELKKVRDCFDIVVITAHGSKASILVPYKLSEIGKNASEYEQVIRIDDTVYLQNKFVATLSCETANVFGHKAVDNGAIAYLGFNLKITETLKIEHIYKRAKYKKYSKKLMILSRKIVTASFYAAIRDFIFNCNSAKRFYDDFCFNIEDAISELYALDRQKIDFKYSVGFKESEMHFFNDSLLILSLKAKELIASIELIGEHNYVPYYFLKMQNPEKLKRIMDCNKDYKDANSLVYKYLVDCICYKILDQRENYDCSIKLLNNQITAQNIPFDFTSLLLNV